MARIVEQPTEGGGIALDPFAVPKRQPITSAVVPRQLAERVGRDTAESLRAERGARIAA